MNESDAARGRLVEGLRKYNDAAGDVVLPNCTATEQTEQDI